MSRVVNQTTVKKIKGCQEGRVVGRVLSEKNTDWVEHQKILSRY